METSNQHVVLVVIIALTVYNVECCVTILQDLAMSSVRCDYTSDPVNCGVTCKQGYMFDDGSTFRVYQCHNNDSFSTPVYKSGCLRRLIPKLTMKVFVDYVLSTSALYCLITHNMNIIKNKEYFSSQLTMICNQKENSKVGNISISNITSRVSGFRIFTTYHIEFKNSWLSLNAVKLCEDHILSNTKSGAVLMHAKSLQCINLNIYISIGYANISTSFCPPMYQPIGDKNDMTYCESVLPLVRIQQFAYVSAYNSNVKLFCEVSMDSSPSNSVYWEHNNEVIEITTRYNGSTLDHPSLIIFNVTSSDSGNYTCNARNEFGQSSSIPISLKVLNETFDGVTALSSDSTTELTTQVRNTLQKVSSEENENSTGKALIVVSIVAALGWTLALILALVMLYRRKQQLSQLKNDKNTTLTYSDLNELSDVSRYSVLQTKKMSSEEYDVVTNQAEYANSCSIK